LDGYLYCRGGLVPAALLIAAKRIHPYLPAIDRRNGIVEGISH
jgi:hypothetical protein